MIFVLTETWPLAMAVEVWKKADLAEKLDQDRVKTNGPYVVMGGDGMKSYTVYELIEGHKHEADTHRSEILKRLKGKFSVPGYRASLEMAATQNEAMLLFDQT